MFYTNWSTLSKIVKIIRSLVRIDKIANNIPAVLISWLFCVSESNQFQSSYFLLELFRRKLKLPEVLVIHPFCCTVWRLMGSPNVVFVFLIHVRVYRRCVFLLEFYDDLLYSPQLEEFFQADFSVELVI